MKITELFESELQMKDNTQIGKIALQIASAAATQYKGVQAKQAAEKAANRVHSILLKNIDDYFQQLQTKNIN